MTEPATITRKEIADIVGVSRDTVRRMDERINLKCARVRIGGRLVLYARGKAFVILRQCGVMAEN